VTSVQALLLVPLVAAAPVMVTAAWSDLRHMLIPNVLSLILVGIFVLFSLAFPPEDLLARLMVAGSVLVLGMGANYLGLFGGGDVKLLSALLLLVPVPTLVTFAHVFSVSMLLGIAAIMLLRRVPMLAATGWPAFRPGRHFPMGVSIGMAGLAHPAVVAAFGI
jgi:prepilin peptidase CpaA